MRTVGLTMIVGVICSFILTVSMTPAIMKLTNYTRHHPKSWTGIARVSSQQWRVILLVVLLVTGYSLARLSVMDQDIRGDESAPEDIASIRKLAEYSEKFEAGQTGILLVAGPPDRPKPAAKDLGVLDVINWTTVELNNLTINNRNTDDTINVSAFSIVDFFKSAHISIEVGQGGDEEPFFVFDGSFWEFLHHEFFDSQACQIETGLFYTCEELRQDMIDVFYDSFTGEMRAMLLTDDYTKALIYVSMPYINIDDTALLVERTDSIHATSNESALEPPTPMSASQLPEATNCERSGSKRPQTMMSRNATIGNTGISHACSSNLPPQEVEHIQLDGVALLVEA
jgi:hypothetical protein